MATKFIIDPPLLNSSSPWATTLADLRTLHDCPFTGAITTRTSMISGFNDNPEHHQHCFFNAGTAGKGGASSLGSTVDSSHDHGNSSLNTYGYSPVPLAEYISYIKQLFSNDGMKPASSSITTPSSLASLSSSSSNKTSSKLIIISVTGTPEDMISSYKLISDLAQEYPSIRLAMEINLSCPNIAHKPPPAYNPSSLTEYLHAIQQVKTTSQSPHATCVPVGLKLPPYTYVDQFRGVVDCLQSVTMRPTRSENNKNEPTPRSVIDFVTSTNTLGSSLVLDDTLRPVLQSEAGTGIGGVAGSSIHALSLGNVSTLRGLLDQFEQTKGVSVIGVGGVSDRAGFERMRSVGADAVGVATALGRDGVRVFEKIATG